MVFIAVPASIAALEDKTVTKGGTVTLFCHASGNPTPSVSWTQVSTGIKRNDATWVLTDIGDSDLGEYRCDASNKYGNDSKTIKVEYIGKCIA